MLVGKIEVVMNFPMDHFGDRMIAKFSFKGGHTSKE
ncbi:MAG: hypothetical protein S4CHLAM45_09440 [Chlamydiales bacterium]|nr:hypothetical protein [Chlamydiales bacterium]MCH9620095.1 hypothetical protein [Chlamydiales bacterium]MCH9623048.1 hypothetical protein [Chlamydiales bacterium]